MKPAGSSNCAALRTCGAGARQEGEGEERGGALV